MLRRPSDSVPDDAAERRAEEDLKVLLGPPGEMEPGTGYWESLIVRINRGIDEVSSGKAISMSWAARVALPGAVAIVFFFVGLHYYVPEVVEPRTSVTDFVLSLPPASQDSLVVQAADLLSVNELGYDALAGLSEDDVVEYLLSDKGDPTLVLEFLPEDQTEFLLARLRSLRASPTL